MNARLTNIIRRRLPFVASTVLLVLGAALAASVLIARAEPETATTTTTAKPPIPNCLENGWPPQDPKKQWLIAAFETALHDSAMAAPNTSPWPTGPELRNKLLDTKNNFQAPKEAMREILKGQGHEMELPKDLVIIFYEEEPPATPTPTPTATPREIDKGTSHPHPNHCYLVLYLDPVGKTTEKSTFQTHVMCCYDPYETRQKGD